MIDHRSGDPRTLAEITRDVRLQEMRRILARTEPHSYGEYPLDSETDPFEIATAVGVFPSGTEGELVVLELAQGERVGFEGYLRRIADGLTPSREVLDREAQAAYDQGLGKRMDAVPDVLAFLEEKGMPSAVIGFSAGDPQDARATIFSHQEIPIMLSVMQLQGAVLGDLHIS